MDCTRLWLLDYAAADGCMALDSAGLHDCAGLLGTTWLCWTARLLDAVRTTAGLCWSTRLWWMSGWTAVLDCPKPGLHSEYLAALDCMETGLHKAWTALDNAKKDWARLYKGLGWVKA